MLERHCCVSLCSHIEIRQYIDSSSCVFIILHRYDKSFKSEHGTDSAKYNQSVITINNKNNENNEKIQVKKDKEKCR